MLQRATPSSVAVLDDVRDRRTRTSRDRVGFFFRRAFVDVASILRMSGGHYCCTERCRISSSSSSSSCSRSQRGPSLRCTTMSTTPRSTVHLQRSPVGRLESFPSCSVDDQVGDATCRQEDVGYTNANK